MLRLLEEHTDREIADQLSIGPRTVATHVTNILNKLGVNSRTAAVAHAIRHGLI
ncbi:MAG: LuxR C-terminal-related transcriptional regulator [Chloroflexota bacterium]|nr:LuxR C-terminal-related transcriptional regulator [Chloroflexota bacterium]